MTRPADERGFALVAALALMVIILGLGIALLTFTDNQQSASLREQASESSFNVAEAALNAQIGQLSRQWPATVAEQFTEACTAASSTETNGCPTAGSMNVAYPNISPLACPAGSVSDPWGAPLTNQWTTYVRDDAEKKLTFNSAVERTQPSYDANNDGYLWVRSVGVVQCRLVTVVSLISRQRVSLSFPTDAASASWFETENNGNKVIADTQGEAAEAGEVSMRCEGSHPKPACEEPQREGQVSPFIKGPPLPSPLKSEAEMAGLKAEAAVNGTLYSAALKNCPGSIAGLGGLPAYVEGCPLSFTGGGAANSAAKPGFLVVADGTPFELNGGATYYGVVYMRNPTNSEQALVKIHGTAQIIGAIDVDGRGGIDFGESKQNFIYDPQALKEVKTFAGATSTRNSFRVLPSTQ